MKDRSTILLPGELVSFHSCLDTGDARGGSKHAPHALVASVPNSSIAIVIVGPSDESTAGATQRREQYLWYFIMCEGRLGWACRNVIMQL